MQNNTRSLSLAITFTLIACVFTSNTEARLHTKKIKDVTHNLEKTTPDHKEFFEESFPRDEDIKQEEKKSGSLWVDSYSARMYNNLHRASSVGDMVTIMIEESAEGTKSAETKVDRKSSHNFSVAGLFGLINQITNRISGLDPDNIVDASQTSKHDGKGETKRKGELQAALTARVVKVLRNGDMQIRGAKNIKVNGEEQALILEGFIRPYDIASDNTILSTYIADARITFNGFGVVADQQKPGWLSSILSKVLPF